MARRREVTHTTDFRTVLRLTTAFIWSYIYSYLCYLRYLNPVFVIRQRQRRFYYVDSGGTILCKPSLKKQFLDLFQSDAAARRKLLIWVKERIGGFRMDNLSTAWQDGIALCTLMEAVCPGACPRHDLLKPHHRVNNCRLGLKLTQRHLEVPQGIITAEEMAIADSSAEPKIRQLLTFIKWASERTSDGAAPCETKRKRYLPSSESIDQVAKSCSVKGNGLMMGLVGKRCKFYIYTDPHDMLDLHIEIKGPHGEICSEKIMSLFPTRKMSQILNDTHSDSKSADVKFVDDGKGHAYFRQKSIETVDEHDGKKIPFDYQSLGKGKYVVSYVPRSAGEHVISVISYGSNISGSPFTARIAESVGHLERQFSRDRRTSAFANRISDSVDSGKSIDSAERDGTGENPHHADQVVMDQTHNFHQNRQSISPRTSVANNRLPKQGTVTRRRVLRRVVTRGGSEITLGESAQPSRIHRQATSLYPAIAAQVPEVAKLRSKTPEVLEVLDKLKRNMARNSVVNSVQLAEAAARTSNEGESPDKLKNNSCEAGPAAKNGNYPGKEGDLAKAGVKQDNRPGTKNMINIQNNTGARNKIEKTETLAQTVVESAMQSAYDSLHKRHYTRQKCVDLSEGLSPVNVDPDIVTDNKGGTITISEMGGFHSTTDNHHDKISEATVDNVPSFVFTNGDETVSLGEEASLPACGTSNLNETRQKYAHGKALSADQRSDSLTLPLVDTEVEKYPAVSVRQPIRQISSSHKSPPDSPSLKLLQSESLHKVCYYISQRAFTHSIPSLQSQTSEGNLRAVNGQSIQDTQDIQESATLPTVNSVSLNAEMSSCENTLGDKPQDCKVCEQVSTSESTLSADTVSATSRRRGSLVRQDVAVLQKVSEESSTGSDKISQKEDYLECETDVQSSKTFPNGSAFHNKMDQGNNGESYRQKSQDLGMTSENCLKKTDTQSSNSLDNETTLFTGASVKNKLLSGFPKENNSNLETNRPTDKEINSIVNVTSNGTRSPTWYSSQMFIRIPTPKIDKWTQISYDEIKRETGWVSPRGAMRQRKMYRLSGRVEINVDQDSSSPEPSTRDVTTDCNGPRSPLSVWYGDNLPQIVYESPEVVDSDRDALVENGQRLHGHYDVRQWLQNNRHEMDGLQPVRQSTVETIDSGIADSRCSSPGRNFRRHRHSIPNPNGHRPVCRHPYQGQIELDPRLLRSASNSPSGDDEKENKFPEGQRNMPQVFKNLVAGHGKVSRTSSEGKRSRRPLPREDSCSLSDTELSKCSNRRSRNTGSTESKYGRRSSGRISKSPYRPQTKGIPKDEHFQRKVNANVESNPNSHGVKLTASQTRKLKFRRRSFALVDSDSQGSVETDDFENRRKDSTPVLTSADELHGLPSPDDKSTDAASPSEHFDHSSRRKSYGGTPCERRREFQMQKSSTLNEDSYFGFGLSRSHRDDLLSQVNSFSNLYEKHNADCPDTARKYVETREGSDPSISPKRHPHAELQWMDESLISFMRNFDSDFTDDASPQHQKLRSKESQENMRDEKELYSADFDEDNDTESNCNETNPIRELFDMLIRYQEEISSTPPDEGDLGLEPIEHSDSTYTNPDLCRAIGPGLESGTVGTKLFFQVITEGAGNGYLTVGVKGPSPDYVGETSVTYSGDYRYEVSYEVTYPGYYAIYVKWSDESIPSSPFIARITF